MGTTLRRDPSVNPEDKPTSKSFFLTLAVVLLGYAMLRGPLILFEEHGPLVASTKELLATGGILLIILMVLGALKSSVLDADKNRNLPSALHPAGFLAGLWLVFLSDWLVYRYNFFQGPTIRGELLCASLVGFFVLRFRLLGLFASWPVWSAIILALGFFQVSKGRLLFSDDHTAVLYRITLLRENFPAIPFYNPLWNAGMDARDFFSTGSLNLYFLFYPLWHLFPPENVYNVVVATIVFILVPGAMFLAGRSLGLTKLEAAIAAGLSLASSIVWFRWCFKYGSMGFITSLSLLPLCLACSIRLLVGEKPFRLREAIFFISLTSLVLFWMMSAIALLPLVIYGLFRCRRVLSTPYSKSIVATLVLLHLPWVVVWLNVADVLHFVTHSSSTAAFHQEVDGGTSEINQGHQLDNPAPGKKRKRGKARKKPVSMLDFQKAVRDFGRNTNPLLVLFGFPGIWMLGRGWNRLLFAGVVGWLLFLGVIVAPFKPQLELDRMLLICSVILCLPAGRYIGNLFDRVSGKERPWTPQVATSLVCGFLLIGTAASGSIVWKRSLETYYFAEPVVANMTEAIIAHGGEGRTLFAGFTLHELSQGHVAPLAYFTRKPLIASSPFHNTWWYTDVIPEHYRKAGPAEIAQYLNLNNVTSVITHDSFWHLFFSSLPDQYEPAWQEGKFTMFKRLTYQSDYFYEGTGKFLGQNTNSATFRIDSDTAILKFNYFPFLQAPGCTVSPFPLPGDVQLVRLSECVPGSQISIYSVGAFERVF